MKNIVLFFLLLVSSWLQSQDATLDYSRLPDKAFLHLDRTLYSTGDTIWAKAYVFHRNNLKLSDTSYALHLQLLNQEGKEVSSHKMLLVDGMGYGQIPVQDWMEPGLYQIVAHSSHMKNFGASFFHRTSIEIRPAEGHLSIKPFFDKPRYGIGDTAYVTFTAYDEFQIPLPKKRFRYELQHQGKSLKKGALRCFDDGSVRFPFPITQGDVGDPLVLHLSYYDNNDSDINYKQQVTVPMAARSIALTFFPEGGELLAGVDNKIAFEATDALGQAVDVEGVLMQGDVDCLKVKSLHRGMGYFTIKPGDTPYRFRVTKPAGIDSLYALPRAVMDAFSLSYVKCEKEKLYLLLSHNYPDSKNVNVWISQNDRLLEVYNLDVKGRRLVTLATATLPRGLLTVTLVDDENSPRAERLVYIPPEETMVEIRTDKPVYSLRKPVSVALKLPSNFGKAQLSVAVVDSVLAYSPWLKSNNIRVEGLLNGELRGPVADLASYLVDDKATEINRNLMLMTHGWRRYNWIYNKQQLDSMQLLNFDRVSGLVMKGRKPASRAKMTAIVLGSSFGMAEFVTEADGRFSITPNYQSRKGQKLLFQARSEKARKNVKITLYNNDTVLFAQTAKRFGAELQPTAQAMHRFVKHDEQVDEGPFFSYESKLLQELVVYGERSTDDDENEVSEAVTSFAAGAMKGEDLYGGYSFVDFVQQVSFRASYDPIHDVITIKSRGGGADFSSLNDDDEEESGEEIGAEIYVNGSSWGKNASQLDFLTKEDIAQIVVLDPDGAFTSYGSQGKYGVVLVNTYDLNVAEEQTLNRNMAVFGRFMDPKEYYSPRYDTKLQDSLVVVDNRITLHWEPFVEIEAGATAHFDFYTDDISGTKQIVVQGIDDLGHLYYATQEFDVKGLGEY